MGNHIIIALGGRGGNCLKSFRKILYKNSLTKQNAEAYPIEYIYVDSDNNDLQNGWTEELGINYSINERSKVNIKDGNNFNDILNNIKRYPNIYPWLGDKSKWANITIDKDQGASQLRRLGRVYFAANVVNNKSNSFSNVLSQVYQSVTAKSGDVSKTTYHIVAGLSGGTGSGTIIDTISLVSNFIKINGHERDMILIYSLLPQRDDYKKDPIGLYYPNTYAALKEINAIGIKQFPKDNKEIEKNSLKYCPFNISCTDPDPNKSYERIEADFNYCFLFSCENENNKIIDDEKALPDLVGDFLYHSIIKLPLNEQGQNAYAKLTENTVIEEEIDLFSGARERTIKFASASIKRIEIPEIEIIDYYGAKLAHQFILQQKFNNWLDEYGYQDLEGEDQTTDFVFNKSKTDNFMFECGITLEHLSLKIPHDVDFQKADDLWDSNNKKLLENTLQVYSKGEEKQPIIYFNKYMENFYKNQFRGSGMGVEKYWYEKNKDLNKQSKYFYDKIERKLIEIWVSSNGRVIGLSEIEKIINKTIEELKNISKKAENRILYIQNPKNDNTIDNDYSTALCNVKILKLIKEYGRLIRFRSRRNIITEASKYITKLYKNKTDVIAYEFALKNIQEIIKNLEILSSQVESIKHNINDCVDFLNDIITEKKRIFDKHSDENSHLSANVKMLYKNESIQKHFDVLLKQKSNIQQCLTNFRRSIVDSINRPTFQSLSEYLNEDKLKSKYLYFLNEQISYIFNHLETEQFIDKNDKLIGRNVLDYFRKEYSNEKLKKYLNEIKEETGVFAKLSNTKSETLDDTKLKTYANDLYIIEIPTYRDDNSAEEYERTFTKIVEEVFGSSSNVIILNVESKRKNEITIFKAKKQMTLRSFDLMSGMLHEKYNSFIKNNPKWSEIGLHTEGTHKDYPKLIPLKDDEEENSWCEIFEEELLPYLLIGLQTGHLQKNNNQTYIFSDNVNSITAQTIIISDKGSSLYEIKNYIFKFDIVSMKRIEDRIGNNIINIINKFIIQKDNKKSYTNWLDQVEKQTLKDILEFDYKNDKSNPEFQKIINAYEKVQRILQ